MIADAAALASSPALDPFRARGAVAAVRRAADGHLTAVSVAVPIALDAEALAARLAAPESWLAFPGWHRAKPLAGDRVAIDDNLPLVDFDAVWQLARDRPRGFTATVVDGATRGALFAWDVAPARAGGAASQRRRAQPVPAPRNLGLRAAQVHRRRAAAGARHVAGARLRRRDVDGARAHQVTVMPALMKLTFWCSAW